MNININNAIDRWLVRNNTSVGPNSDNYDHELEVFLFDADADFLLVFFQELSKKKLRGSAVSILGAGLMEDFLAKYPDQLESFKLLLDQNEILMDAAQCMLPRNDMMEDVNTYIETLIYSK